VFFLGCKVIRIAIVALSCWIMWLQPSSNIDFFRSLLILSLGFAYDYWSVCSVGITEDEGWHKIFGGVGTLIAVIFCLIAVGGLIGTLTLNMSNESFYISNTNKMMLKISFSLDGLLEALSTIFPILACGEMWGEFRRTHKLQETPVEN
jgi:hypothetical protein